MTKLYALDFDKTLIPYDSFNRFLKLMLATRPFRVGFLLAIRKLRLVNSTTFKRSIYDMVMADSELQEKALAFARILESTAHLPRCVEEAEECIVLIISASPACYMRYIKQIDGKNVVVAASNYTEGRFCQLYGEAKKEYLLTNYPQTDYLYEYAASDSKSDLVWMELFNNYIITPLR